MNGRSRARSFLLGGLVGASAALAAVRRNRRRSQSPTGLAAFEEAPCFQETLERERAEASDRSDAPMPGAP